MLKVITESENEHAPIAILIFKFCNNNNNNQQQQQQQN
jgi:hypothetical protein